MGYNGNNRGRTHNWSGIGNKKNYNWGLNLTAKALVAPFAILGALIDLADDINTHPSENASSINAKSVNPPKHTPSQPHNFIKTLFSYYPELSQRITKLSKQESELSSLKRKLQSVRRNVFLMGKRKRIINVLKYRILRKEQFVSSYHLFEEDIIGEPIDSNQIKGKVTVLFFDQAKSTNFHEGIILKIQYANFYNRINKIQSLSLKGADWQMVFYSNGLLLEDNKQILYVPYNEIVVKETKIVHCIVNNTQGYDVKSTSWMFTRLDGGPDLRYSSNRRIYYVQRYQVELRFMKTEKESSLYLVFQKKEDSETFCKIISTRIKNDPG